MVSDKVDTNRLSKRLKLYGIICLVGIIYYIWIRLTGIGIPCPVKLITGWSCPGCGVTTLCLSLSEGKLHDAFHANPFLLVTSPLIAYEIIYNEYRYIFNKQERTALYRINNAILIIYIGALVIFGILRNII